MTRSHTTDRLTGSAELAELVERLADELRAGRSIDWAAVGRDHPAHAAEARRLLPTLERLADLSAAPLGPGGGPVAPLGPAAADGTLGDYRIVREVGRGGMGVVYEAEQISLRRRVALKVLPFAAVMDPRQLQRFKNEALAAASLDHPHVVKVHGVGCERGVHFIALQYIDGRPLSALVRDRRGTPAAAAPATRTAAADATATYAPGRAALGRETPLTSVAPRGDAAYFRTVAGWGADAADALEHAHGLGVVHRDVKPGNILVDGAGRVYVADFGLAKLSSDPGVTGTGDLLGTVRYMSPEQAGARHDLVDHRSDIYSLGVTLYELLTLVPAFAGADRQAVLSAVLSSDPAAPRSHDRGIPRDLETVVLKAMDKDPARRYQTAAEFAADLRRFLAHQPVRAKPPGVLDRVAKWGRRHRGSVAIGTGAAAAVVLGLGVSLALTYMAYQSEAQARRDATDAGREAGRERDLSEDRLYLADMGLAQQYLQAGHVSGLRDMLDYHDARPDRPDRRKWEWHHLAGHLGLEVATHDLADFAADTGEVRDIATGGGRVTILTQSKVVTVALSADGRHVRSHRTLTLGRPNFTHVYCVSADGGRAARMTQGRGTYKVEVFSLDDGVRERACSISDYALGGHFALTPDGKRLAVGGGQLFGYRRQDDRPLTTVWDTTTGEELAVCGLAPNQPIGPAEAWTNRPMAVWRPDGRAIAQILAGAFDNAEFPQYVARPFQVRLWDAASGAELATIKSDRWSVIHSLAWRPDGDRLAMTVTPAAGDGEGRLTVVWNTATGREEYSLPTGGVSAWSEDGRLLATTNSWSERGINLWSAATGRPLVSLAGHTQNVVGLAWLSSRRLVSIDRRGEMKVWDLSCLPHDELLGAVESPDGICSPSWHPDGNLLLATGRDLRVWDWPRRKVVFSIRREQPPHTNPQVIRAAWSPDGRWLAVGRRPPDSGMVAQTCGVIDLWDTTTWELKETLSAPYQKDTRSEVGVPSWNLDGSRVGGSGFANEPFVWEVASGKLIDFSPVGLPKLSGTELHLAAKDRWVAGAESEGVRGHFRGDAQKATFYPEPYLDPVFGRQGQMAVGGAQGMIRVWADPLNAAPSITLRAPCDYVGHLCLSPDGRQLVSLDQRVRLWDLASGREMLTLDDTASLGPLPQRVDWSRDGRRIAVGYSDRSVQVWDALATYDEKLNTYRSVGKPDP